MTLLKITSEREMVRAISALRCIECSNVEPFTGNIATLDEADRLEAQECDCDVAVEALIITDEPLLDDDFLDDDYEVVGQEEWEYPVTKEMLDLFIEADLRRVAALLAED